MANRKVRIVRDVKLDGQWATLSLKKAQKLKIPAAEGRWYITWREGRRIKREQARDHGHAIGLQGKKHAELHATAFGIKITPDNPNRLRLEKAFDDFIEDQKQRDWADKTVDAYRAVKKTFLKSSGHQFLDQVTRRDLLQYAEYLRKREGLSDRTVHARWTAVKTVLKHHNVRGLAKRGDTPQYVEEDAEAYLQTELDAVFKVMKPEYDLLFTFYLRTGFRMQEVMYLKWSDVNFETQTVRVKAKPEHEFIPKRWHERSVPLEEGLLRRLEERRKVRKANDLVFPTRNGKPNGKHLVALKRLAKKAKQDPAQFWLHKFRASAATNWLRAGIDVRRVQKLLGHRNLASTLRYLQPLQIADIGKSAAWKAVHAGA
jgi:integrase/recombinase XerD